MFELTELIKTATQRISAQYFQIALDGGDPIYRERVYCYEFYHQLRCVWPADTDFYLNGELDKAAHPILRKLGADFAKPDLLVHRPGYMKGNHTIIEVKPSGARRDGICKDIETLSIFGSKVGYARLIYLIYGHDAEKTAKRVHQIAEAAPAHSPIELWLHSAPGEMATHTCCI